MSKIGGDGPNDISAGFTYASQGLLEKLKYELAASKDPYDSYIDHITYQLFSAFPNLHDQLVEAYEILNEELPQQHDS